MTTKAPITTIFYPETDGLPLPDGRYQYPLQASVVLTLRAFFNETPRIEVNGNTFIYYVEGNPRLNFAPDCHVTMGLTEDAMESLDRNNTYLLWEVGKPPDFIMEIASQSTWRVDQGFKRDLYAQIGVGEYWLYDQTGGDFYDEPLVGERLVGGEYEPLEMRRESDGSVWGHSDALNLDLWWIDGELRFWDPVGEEWLRNQDEERAGRLAETARADAERDARLTEAVRADSERDARVAAEDARVAAEARADAADARNARLKAELRRLRGE